MQAPSSSRAPRSPALPVKRILSLFFAGMAVACGYRLARPGDVPKGQAIRVAGFQNYTAQVEAGGLVRAAVGGELFAPGGLGPPGGPRPRLAGAALSLAGT